MSNPLLNACASLILSLALTTAVAAAESHACTTVIDPAERLACYDAAFPPVSGARSGAIDVAAEREKARQNFGLNRLQVNERQPEQLRDLAPERIEAKVARLSMLAGGERVVGLDNDQTWLLTEATSKGRLKIGDPVVVRTAALGTFMLVTPGRVALRARRIK
ncbi:MAG: hypothetical protein WC213_01480 [Arenimonas sp.]